MSNDDMERAATLLVYRDALVADLAKVNGDEFQTLKLLVRYFRDTHMPPDLVAPLVRRMGFLADDLSKAERRERGVSGSARSFNELSALATCAATITVLKERGKRVPAAVREVSKASGIDERTLKGFRDGFNRGTHSAYATALYRDQVAEMRAMQPSEFDLQALARIRNLPGFVSDPAKAHKR
jgi:hypothetical protein